MKVFKVKIVWEGSKFWNNLLPSTLFWNYMVTAKQSGIFFRLFVTFSEYLNFIRVGRLYEILAIVHTAALCLFIIIGKSVTLLLKWLSFFCKGNRRSPQPLSLLGPRPTGIQAAKGQLISKANFEVFIWTKKRTKIFLYFCPNL